MSIYKERAEIDQSDATIDTLTAFRTVDQGAERAFRLASQALESFELAKASLGRPHAHGLSHEAGELVAMLGNFRNKLLHFYEHGGSFADSHCGKFEREHAIKYQGETGLSAGRKESRPYEDFVLSDDSEISRDLLHSRALSRLPELRSPSVRILLHLISRPSEIVPIEMLAIASGTKARTTEIIKVYMSALRKALTVIGFGDAITTHSKRGYSICPIKSLEIVAFLSE
ncbi:MAG: helix-turn-helix domain-containing protein [Novosphingobium sp.]